MEITPRADIGQEAAVADAMLVREALKIARRKGEISEAEAQSIESELQKQLNTITPNILGSVTDARNNMEGKATNYSRNPFETKGRVPLPPRQADPETQAPNLELFNDTGRRQVATKPPVSIEDYLMQNMDWGQGQAPNFTSPQDMEGYGLYNDTGRREFPPENLANMLMQDFNWGQGQKPNFTPPQDATGYDTFPTESGDPNKRAALENFIKWNSTGSAPDATGYDVFTEPVDNYKTMDEAKRAALPSTEKQHHGWDVWQGDETPRQFEGGGDFMEVLKNILFPGGANDNLYSHTQENTDGGEVVASGDVTQRVPLNTPDGPPLGDTGQTPSSAGLSRNPYDTRTPVPTGTTAPHSTKLIESTPNQTEARVQLPERMVDGAPQTESSVVNNASLPGSDDRVDLNDEWNFKEAVADIVGGARSGRGKGMLEALLDGYRGYGEQVGARAKAEEERIYKELEKRLKIDANTRANKKFERETLESDRGFLFDVHEFETGQDNKDREFQLESMKEAIKGLKIESEIKKMNQAGYNSDDIWKVIQLAAKSVNTEIQDNPLLDPSDEEAMTATFRKYMKMYMPQGG